MVDDKTKIRPLGNRVVLRVLARPGKSKGGIILAESRGREDTGIVEACGPEAKGVTPGQVVSFDPYRVSLAIGPDGPDMTNSVHARAGMIAIVNEDALRYVFDYEPPPNE